MYNGIGLRTARGSGTNGFVQRNLSYIRPSRVLQFSQKNEVEIMEPKMKQQDKSILEHQVRREIEVALLDLEEKMEEQGYFSFFSYYSIVMTRRRFPNVLKKNAK